MSCIRIGGTIGPNNLIWRGLQWPFGSRRPGNFLTRIEKPNFYVNRMTISFWKLGNPYSLLPLYPGHSFGPDQLREIFGQPQPPLPITLLCYVGWIDDRDRAIALSRSEPLPHGRGSVRTSTMQWP
jgi:hypothetical protein